MIQIESVPQHESESRPRADGAPGILWTARIVTGLLAAVWVFFGVNWLRLGPDIADAMAQLRYPMYIAPIIGVTHMLGGVGLLVPNRPRLTEWVYAGLTCDLILAAASHVLSHDAVSNALHPIILLAVLAASYVLRRRVGGANLWASPREVG